MTIVAERKIIIELSVTSPDQASRIDFENELMARIEMLVLQKARQYRHMVGKVNQVRVYATYQT